jgi:hypothetical protein
MQVRHPEPVFGRSAGLISDVGTELLSRIWRVPPGSNLGVWLFCVLSQNANRVQKE